MKKILPILLIIISLKISAQLKCWEYDPDACGIFNNDYTLKCHKFTSCLDVQVDSGCKIENDKCVKNDNKNEKEICKFYDIYAYESGSTLKVCKKVLIDDGCKVTDNYICEAADSNSNVKCDFNEALDHCQKFDKVCTDYSNNDCGGLKTNVKAEDRQQCIKLPNYNTNCLIIDIDEHCKVTATDSSYSCEPRSSDFDSENYKCVLNLNMEKPECKRQAKYCHEITILDSCERGATIDSNNNCKVITIGGAEKCIEVKTHDSCKIDNKQCKIKTSSETQACKLDTISNGYYCRLYQKDPDCNTDTDFTKCQYKGSKDNEKCVPLNDNTECRVQIKTCSDYIDSTKCENANIGTNKKCSWDSSSYYTKCKEYEIDDTCTVTNAQCGVKSGKTESNNMKCLFTNSTKVKCNYLQDTCKNYYDNCDSHDRTNEKIQCALLNYGHNCKEVQIDDKCNVQNYKCVPKGTIEDTQNCYFNEEKTVCKIGNKQCKEYNDQSSCNANDRCSYISYDTNSYSYYNCHETETENEQVCKITNNECKAASGSSINSDKEKCYFVYDEDKKKAVCKKIDLACSEITKKDVCNSVSTNTYKCHYLDGSCFNIALDGNCTMNSEDKCVENGSGKLSSTDMCYLYKSTYSRTGQCYKREKMCSDIALNDCNSYQPVNRKCFYIGSSSGSSGTCKEIKVDSQCKINDDNECTGNGCSYKDDNKDHCAYKSGSSMLKIRTMFILALFFIL